MPERGPAPRWGRALGPAARAALGAALAPPRRGSPRARSSTADQGRHDHAPLGLIALAEGLDARPILEMLVDEPPLGRGHRLELDLLARLEGSIGGAIGLALHRLAASLPVARRVHHDALSILASPERGAVAEELHRIDRLAAATDQQADLLALHSPDDLLGAFLHLD